MTLLANECHPKNLEFVRQLIEINRRQIRFSFWPLADLLIRLHSQRWPTP